MSNDFDKVPEEVWSLFQEIMWCTYNRDRVELLSNKQRWAAQMVALGWDPPLLSREDFDRLTPHGLAFVGWQELQALRPMKKRTGRPKKGEAPGDTKIIAALCQHHGYQSGADGLVAKHEPATLEKLAKLAETTTKTVSVFFRRKFEVEGTRAKRAYDQTCAAKRIGFKLALWRGDMSRECFAKYLANR